MMALLTCAGGGGRALGQFGGAGALAEGFGSESAFFLAIVSYEAMEAEVGDSLFAVLLLEFVEGWPGAVQLALEGE
jgi:hypothetical protein